MLHMHIATLVILILFGVILPRTADHAYRTESNPRVPSERGAPREIMLLLYRLYSPRLL